MHEHVVENGRLVVSRIVELITGPERNGIIFVTGPLMSGKTLVAIDLVDRLQKRGLAVAVGQPAVERPDVSAGELLSRTGRRIATTALSSPRELRGVFARADVVVLDEVQFLRPLLQEALRQALAGFSGWGVIMGLQYTSVRTEFPICAFLKAKATVVFRLTATCVVCGCPSARHSQRLIDGRVPGADTPVILPPSASVSYEPRCENCHQL